MHLIFHSYHFLRRVRDPDWYGCVTVWVDEGKKERKIKWIIIKYGPRWEKKKCVDCACSCLSWLWLDGAARTEPSFLHIPQARRSAVLVSFHDIQAMCRMHRRVRESVVLGSVWGSCGVCVHACVATDSSAAGMACCQVADSCGNFELLNQMSY